MQDGNAYFAVGVNFIKVSDCLILTVWVPHFANELHLRRVIGIVLRELECRLEKASLLNEQSSVTYLVESVSRSFENHIPEKQVMLVLQTDTGAKLLISLDFCKLKKSGSLPLSYLARMICVNCDSTILKSTDYYKQ